MKAVHRPAPAESGMGKGCAWVARFGLAIGVVLAILASTLIATADSPDVHVATEPDGTLTVGDPVEIQVTIGHELGARVLVDASVVQMGGMEPSAPVITELSETETLVVYQTRAFATGAFEVALPPIPIQLADRSVTELALRPVSLTIASVLDGAVEPRPLTGPDLLEGDSPTFTPWIVAIIGIGAGFLLARVVRGRYRRPVETVGGEAPELAVRERGSFDVDPSLNPADQCRQLATSVRSRLSDDWSLPASALTASEIGPALAAAGASGAVVLRVTQLLEACDRAQYGGEQPTPERLHGYTQLAEAIWSDGNRSDGAAP